MMGDCRFLSKGEMRGGRERGEKERKTNECGGREEIDPRVLLSGIKLC